jgi:transposase-like protein
MTHLTVEYHDGLMEIRSQVFCGTFQETENNKRLLFILLRLFVCPMTGKPFFTWQEIADAFGKKDRRNMQNFMQEFQQCEGDFLRYLARKATKKDAVFPLVEAQILAAPLLSIAKHYRAFCATHTQERVCEQTFRHYIHEIPATKILKRIRQLGFKQERRFDMRRYLQELLALDTLSQAKKKEIVEQFPDVEPSRPCSLRNKGERLTSVSIAPKLLAVILYVCGLSQEMLAMLFGVSKTSIHHWMYTVCSDQLYWEILHSIQQWSGQVSFDEKWIKIKGTWHFVLCAVDSVSGFPLLMDIYPTLDTDNWTLFFKRFKALYGKPKLIQSDGSQPLAAAREVVFSKVRYQLCKFHKLRNLMKRLRKQVRDPKRLRRFVRLAKHMFTNKSVSSRKYAAKRLQQLAGETVSSYIDEHILAYWRQLTMSLTTNASERFNRKIEKCFCGRYGIASVGSANVLLRGLFLKELLLNGKKHLDQTSELGAIDVSRICQKTLDGDQILHFFHDYAPSQVDKVA